MRKSVIAAVVLFASLASAEDKKHSIADLKNLVAQDAFMEAALHLGDVTPSERNADWLDVAAKAGAGLLKKDEEQALSYAMAFEDQYPQVLKSATYTKVRNASVMKGLEQCMAGSWGLEECFKTAAKLVKGTPGDRAFSLKVAKLARKSAHAYNAVPLFKLAMGAKDNAAVCKDGDTVMAVVSGLGLPPDYAQVPDAKAIAASCFPEMKTELLEAFTEDSEGGYFQTNSCDLLKAKKALTTEQAKGCTKK